MEYLITKLLVLKNIFYLKNIFVQREGWNALSSTAVWRQLVEETRKAGRDHGALAEIYNANITSRWPPVMPPYLRLLI